MLFGKLDLEVTQAWGLPNYGVGDDMCPWCYGNRSTLPHTDLQASAAWRAMPRLNNEVVLARTYGCHPILSAPFWNLHFVRMDGMHVLDHNGVTAIANGSCLHELVKNEHRLGHNQEERMNSINSRLATFNANHIQSSFVTDIRVDNLKQANGWSCLHGPMIKAASNRHLTPFVTELVHEFCDSGSEYHESMKLFMSGLCHIYEIIYSAGFFFTAAELKELDDTVLAVGIRHQFLRHLSDLRGDLMFQVTPKVHIMQHTASQSALVNVRWLQNYAEESMIGVITRIWHASAAGPYQKRIQKTTLLKWLVRWCIEMEL
jgi:hypothetical protein